MPADPTPAPPRWPRESHEVTAHGHTRTDPYYWIRDRDDERLVPLLEEENAWLAEVAERWSISPDQLYEEIRARIQEEDDSVPYRIKDYWYRTRFEEGGEYPVFLRRHRNEDAEFVILDVGQLAEGQPYCDVTALYVSEGQSLLAYAVDYQGRRLYDVRIRDLDTGSDLDDRLTGTSGAVCWAGSDQVLFYVRQDQETLRPYQIFRHRLGTAQDDDELVFEEQDEAFHLTVFRTKSRRFVMAASVQTMTTEFRALPAERPSEDFKILIPRERGHEYSVDHYGDHFYIRTNREARNFRLVRAPVEDPSPDRWEDIIPHRPDVMFQGVEIFTDYMVAVERSEALTRFRVMPWEGPEEHVVEFPEEAYTAYLTANFEYESSLLRFGYTSLTTPNSIYDYDMETRERTLLKRRPVLGDFDPDRYVTRRLWAPGRDGARVPVSLVVRKDLEDQPCPLLLYGYGAYGIDSDPYFQISNLSLLDRGFAYAIAHVRGGEELGRAWYEEGRTAAKMNSFTDFIDVAEFLQSQGRASRLYAMGGSAGGLLVGAVMNLRPDLFHGVVAAVPFVDVATTMLDPSIPLTTGEYDEWGDPGEERHYRTILTYSPYDNVSPQPYPHLLVTSGIHDSQVQYWEPTKWVAKLRSTRTDDGLTLLRTNLEAGHGGASGRFESLRERALEYAFLLGVEEAAHPRG
ncbi:MAG: S9 family peptidase [Gemmatimonadetes bacterium]|nr:S9 family peptidase [Gemmatimonadota bacterium]